MGVCGGQLHLHEMHRPPGARCGRAQGLQNPGGPCPALPVPRPTSAFLGPTPQGHLSPPFHFLPGPPPGSLPNSVPPAEFICQASSDWQDMSLPRNS